MEIERIDEIYVIFNNQKYKKDKRSGYYWSLKLPRTSLHFAVFEYHGNIRGEDCELHHIDFDKENNNISNIVSLTIPEHRKIHLDYNRQKYGKNFRKENIKKAQKGLAEWRKTEKYKKWLDDNQGNRKDWARKSHTVREKGELICDICGEKFTGYIKRKKKHCSEKCRAKYRRESGLDDVEKKCIICGKIFVSNKYKDFKTCSKSCRSVLSYSNRNKNKKNN